MAKIAEALAAVVRETTRENLDALLHVTGHDLDTLLELATNGENNHQASSIVLAASMQRVYRFVDANWQDTMGFRAQVVEANLTCSSEMQNFGFRLAALENVLAKIEGHLAAHPPSTANTAHLGVTPFVIPVPTLLTARVEAVEAKLSNVEETINMAVHRGGGGGRSNNDHEDDMDRILERLRNLGEMRKEAAANKLERAEEEREERLGEMDDNHDELEQRVDIHDEELREVKRGRFVRRLCMYLIAHFTRDLTTDEVCLLAASHLMGHWLTTFTPAGCPSAGAHAGAGLKQQADCGILEMDWCFWRLINSVFVIPQHLWRFRCGRRS